MGLKIWDLFPKKEIEIEDLKGKKLALDTSSILYQFLASIRQRDGTPLTDKKGNITSHLMGLLTRTTSLMASGLRLCYILDGRPPALKFKEKERRKLLKEKAIESYKKAKTQEEKIKFAKRTSKLTPKIVKESKELIQALGLPVIQAPSEAEAQCAFMAEKKDVWATVSQDADALLYNTPRLIRNLTISQKRRLPSGTYVQNRPEIIELNKVLKSLKINQDQLIALGILVGSVDYNEPTIFKNNGTIKMNSIGECPENHPLEVPCFDTNTKKITFKKVKKYIKHKINEPLYEVTTMYNRKVKVTKSHSLFIKKNNKITAVKTPELKVGDKLVVPVKIPHQNEEIKEINIAQELWKHKDKLKRLIYCDGKNIQEIHKKRLLNHKDKRNTERRYILTKYGIKKLRKLRIDKKIITTETPLNPTTLYEWEKGKRDLTETRFKDYLKFLGTNLKKFNNDKKSIKKIRKSCFEEKIIPLINYKNKCRKTLLFKLLSKEEVDLLSKQDSIYGRTRSRNPLSPILKITPELIRLIGYFLAEGHLNGDYRVNFSFALDNMGHDNYCVKDTINCIKKVFKTTPKVYNEKSTRHICIDNCVIHDFFAYILGLEKQNSKTKKIPYLIFNVNPELQIEFLKGFFLGDGSLHKDHIRFNTASYNLAVGVTYILLQQGIIFSTTFQNEKNYNMKGISICGKDQLLKYKKIWEKHHMAKRIINHCKKPLRQKPNIEIDGDLGYVKIRSINQVKPSSSYVYDFSVDGENFIAGFGGICCHNTDYNPGGVFRIGQKTALKLVKQYKSFDKLFKEVAPGFNWKKVYAIFKSMPVMKNYQLKWNEIDEEKMKRLLVDKHDFAEERVDSMIQRVTGRPKQQLGLSKWAK